MIELKFTETFENWFEKLKDRKARARITARLNRLQEGLAGDVQPAGEGISELRIHYGPGYRVYYLQRGSELIILLCGGDKKTQSRDINQAKRLATQWRN
ncbi:type II toxin-antitoxin system RelE/ParE family toxin [Cohaesibacter celericrescens]|uniref:Addiction module antitoxin RelB n=1 Tax=Cohaesibacter celericrescens TaxID=2067669 RepID=A0A2N5XJX6_9HYPH|nr:type II toxin-antitoxin system RelE/ParE family toxin [Cohaesibacter celericrescens]PLW74806.1 hypothetical protein C0081_22980 [Cohaesibacter celericrescens]